jgi:1-deoxy-D-xylulose-5-phosphate synthase
MIKTPVVRVGWPDQFIEHGALDILRKKHGITPEAAVEKILPFVKQSAARQDSVA